MFRFSIRCNASAAGSYMNVAIDRYHSLQHLSGKVSGGKFDLATDQLFTRTDQCGENPAKCM